MRPGYNLTVSTSPGDVTDFNEAGAHAPRILPEAPFSSTSGTGHFNEAGAHAPRILIFGPASFSPQLELQ